MPLIEEMFDQQKVDSLKRYLQREADKGRTKDYEIIVDNFKVVSRTDDITEFDDYEDEIKSNTRNVSILIFDGRNTNRNTRYSFSLRGDADTPKKPQSVAGLGEIDQVIAQKLEEKEREHEYSRIKEQLTSTQAQLAEAEEYAEGLQKRIKEMEDKRYTNSVTIGEVASVVLKTLVKQHADRLPGGQVLAGLLGADIPEELPLATPTDTSSPVTFEKQPETPLRFDEQTRNRLSLIEQMQQRFNEQQMVSVFSIIDVLATDPDKINAVITHLGLQTASAA